MNKSVIAFEMTCENLFRFNPKVYFWTLTFVSVPINDSYAMEDWHFLMMRLTKHFPMLEGVRVCELHKFHGIHFHLLINTRIPIERMKKIAHGNWALTGNNRYLDFGRMSVSRCDKKTAGYLSKYLTKSYRGRNNFWGRRRWGTINGKFGALLDVSACDIEIESDATRNREKIYGRLKSSFMAWILITHYTKLWGDFEEWPELHKAAVWKHRTKDHSEWMKRYENEPF